MELTYFEEPQIIFGHEQKATDPRDGLILFGPNQPLEPHTILAGVVGTKKGIELYSNFVSQINTPIFSTFKDKRGQEKSGEIKWPSFPGFQNVFSVQWPATPSVVGEIDEIKLYEILKSVHNKRERTKKIVELYFNVIQKIHSTEAPGINLWFVIVPKIVYLKCKPESFGVDYSKRFKEFIDQTKMGQQLIDFSDMKINIEEMEELMNSSFDFHHLMKSTLIHNNIAPPAQIILEPTLDFRDKERNTKMAENIKSHVAWTQSSTVYYKLGYLPWKLCDVRPGVCYVGLIFKRIGEKKSGETVCSAAQMFLSDGDGAVFRGNIGLWETDNGREYHLDTNSAYKLLLMALDDYLTKLKRPPNELFIHGRCHFNDIEWSGFEKAIKEKTNGKTALTGVVIKDKGPLKIFRDVVGEKSEFGVLRGMAMKVNEREAFLFTRGFIPRLNSANHLESPNPLHIQIDKGDGNLDTVLKDILALTKLNYNACIHGDGLPVTLRFSKNIGDILTATSDWEVTQRNFKYYI